MTNFGAVNTLAVNTTRQTTTASAYSQFLADAKRAAVFFMHLTVRDRTETAAEGFLPPVAVNTMRVNGVRQEDLFNPSSETLFYSSRNWIGRPDDALKPNTAARRRLIAAFRIRRTTPYFPSEDNRIQTTVANAVLDNAMRDLDFLAFQKALESTRAPIHHGPLDGPFSDAQKLAEPTIKGVSTSGDELRIEFSSTSSQFATTPLQSARYDGAGGLGGDIDLKDTLKPFVVGSVFNMPPTLIDSELFIYQAHSRRLNGIGPVWEGANPIPFDQDYDSYAALAEADIPSGYYATCKLFGVFRLSQAPTKKITCSVRGDALAGSYVSDSGKILLRVLTTTAGKPTSLFNISSFSRLSKATIGWYNERKDYTVEQFINLILKPENAVLGETRQGLLGIIKHRPLDEQVGGKQVRIRPTQIDPVVLQEAPLKKETLYYGWNWSPFTSEDEFAEVVPDSERPRFRDQAIAINVVSPVLSALRTDAIPGEKITWFAEDESVAANDQANADMQLYGRGRIPYRISLQREGFGIKDGEVFTIITNRFGFDEGKKVTALAFDESARGETVIVEVMS